MRVYDFGSGRTDPGSFPTEALAEAAREAVREIGPELCRYPGDMGHQGLREVMAVYGAGRIPATFVTRQGDLLAPEGLLRGGSSNEVGHLARSRELRSLEVEVGDLEAQAALRLQRQRLQRPAQVRQWKKN